MRHLQKFSVQNIPPYGTMADDYLQLLGTPSGLEYCHPAWKTHADWEKFTGNCLDLIAREIWPQYDFVQHKWVGQAGTRAVELTYEDFELMIRWRAAYELNPALRYLKGGNPSAFRTHLNLFRQEDEASLGEGLLSYSRAVYELVSQRAGSGSVQALFGLYLGDYFTRIILELKQKLQRPRPYQMALILNGISGFRQERSVSFVTPSIISGHCFEGIMGCAEIVSQMDYAGIKLSKADMASFAQYAADIGDRRIIAGVHYPSDSIASWTVAIQFADYAYGKESTAKKFVIAAIRSSAIWGRTGGKGRLRELLKMIQASLK